MRTRRWMPGTVRLLEDGDRHPRWHNASVALVRNGRIEFALQEERITRIKNQGDAPAHALDEARSRAGGGAESARIALNGRYMNYGQWQRETILDDYGRSSTFASRIRQPLKDTFFDHAYQRSKAAVREEHLGELGLNRERMEPVEHHLAHASAAYYTCPWPDERVLVLTCDGSGDRLAATVSPGRARRADTRRADSRTRFDRPSVCNGDAPHGHGAPGTRIQSDGVGSLRRPMKPRLLPAAEWFRQMFEFTRGTMTWQRRRGVPSMYSAGAFLDRLLAGQRFDLIAAGIQRFVEDWLAAWARNCIRETGIRKVACSGGVFMNVKANLRLLEIPELEDLYIFPSCGDESNSIGAALQLAARTGQPRMGALGPIYYGEPITDDEADRALDAAGYSGRFRAAYVNDIERKTAEALAQGNIVARAKGPMEFGARALGNRSILARADSPVAVRIINQMVKSRDFWMPFAPSVMAERADDYYMQAQAGGVALHDVRVPLAAGKARGFAAAQHPYDFTTRPQEVTAAHNAEYHRLLKEYEARTGEGIVLNTSFNLHGEPMVYRARDAVDVFSQRPGVHGAGQLVGGKNGEGSMKTLVTGAAGFIGYHVSERLLAEGRQVVGIDNLNAYYDPGLKRARLARLTRYPGFEFTPIDIADRAAVEGVFSRENFGNVIHLAAQPGVRHSIEHPHACAEANLIGFLHVLEGCRHARVQHLIYASSSSVYGGNTKLPFATADPVDSPISLYAATKRANELMAHCYSHLYDLPAAGSRFFTVYGPWGRPDMAPFPLRRGDSGGQAIDVYNYGRMWRDFTYIDDIAEGVLRIAAREPMGSRVFNVWSSQPVGLMEFIGELERRSGAAPANAFSRRNEAT